MDIDERRDDRRERLNLAELQFEASSTIYGSSDPVEILNALVNFGGKSFAKAQLGLLDPDSQILNVIAVRDDNGIRTAQIARRLDEYPAHETLSAVESLYIPDVSADPFLTTAERATLQEHGYGAMLVVPLVVAQRLIGVVDFTDPQPVEISPHTLRAMRNLGDQIAVVFENQALLRSTATTLDEVQALYDINRAMLGALDPLAVLHVLRTRLAQDATSITHAVVERSPESTSESIIIRHIATPTDEQTVEIPTQGLRKAVDAFGEAESTGVVFVEDMDNPAEVTLLHDTLKAENAHSYIAVVIREHGAITDFIAVAYDRPHIFDSRTRRLYTAVADQIGIVLQNQRLLRDAQSSAAQLTQQVGVLQGLNRLSIGISSFQSDQDLLDYAAQTLMTALNVDHVSVTIFETTTELGRVVSEYPAKDTVGTQIEAPKSKIIAALREAPDQPVVIHDLEHSIQIELETRQKLRKRGVFSLMTIGLRSSGQLVGTVSFDLYDPTRQFAPEMIETAQTMVAQIAIGLQNIRLLTEAQRRAEQLQRIATFGQSVQATLKLDTILSIVLSESRAMISMDRMSVALYDSRQAQLRVIGQFEEGDVSIDLENGPLLSMNGTFVGRVWETHDMLAISDTHIIKGMSRIQDLRLATWAYQQVEAPITGISRMQDLTMRSVMVAPIRSRGRLIGTVTVGCFLPYSYAEADQAIFQQMVNQLAVAIENADAYTQSQRVAQNEALINEIATHFQQHTDVEDMLQIAINELGQALGARRGRIRLSMDGSKAVDSQAVDGN